MKKLFITLASISSLVLNSCGDENTCYHDMDVITVTDTVYIEVEPAKPGYQDFVESKIREYFLSVYKSEQLYTETESFSIVKQVKGWKVFVIDYTWRSFDKKTGDDYGVSSRTYYISIDFEIISAASSKAEFERVFVEYIGE